MPLIQNFSVPAGDTVDVDINVGPTLSGIVLENWTATWDVFVQTEGVPDLDSTPIISKSSDTDGGIVISDDSNLVVSLLSTDTTGLVGNYYHRARIEDPDGNPITITYGVMTVLEL